MSSKVPASSWTRVDQASMDSSGSIAKLSRSRSAIIMEAGVVPAYALCRAFIASQADLHSLIRIAGSRAH